MMPSGDQSSGPAPGRRSGLGLLRRFTRPAPPEQRLLTTALLGSTKRVAAEAQVRALATAVPMVGELLLCRVLGQYKMLVSAADQNHAPHLALDGYWEWWTTAFLARTLRRGQRVIDAGACYGYFTLLAADLVGSSGRVVAIEPNPPVAALLARNAALNGYSDRVEVAEVALAGPTDPPTMRLQASAEAPKDAQILPPQAAAGGPLVSTVRLKQFIDHRPDLLKLDINGTEEAVWPDVLGLLASNPGMQVLLSFDAARYEAPAAFIAAIAAQYSLRRISGTGEAKPCSAAELLGGGEAMLYLASADH